jgi:hypothetical protein
MPIDFRCPKCDRLLRTGDDTAGRKACCPQCGAIMTVPTPAPEAAGPGGAPPPPPGDNPFVPGVPPVLPPESGNPYQSPSPFAAPRPNVPPGAIVPGRLDFSEVLGRTWNILKTDWGNCLVVVVIALALNFAVNMASGFLPIVGAIIGIVFQTWIQIGQALFFLKKARGQDAQIGDLFQGGPYLLKTLGAGILVGLICLGIVVVCVVPLLLVGLAVDENAAPLFAVGGGLIAIVPIYCVALMTSQFSYLILDRNAGVIESLTMSRDLMVGNKLMLFAIWLVTGVAGGLIVLLTCFLGILLVAPYCAMMTAVIYLLVTGQPMIDQATQTPSTSRGW